MILISEKQNSFTLHDKTVLIATNKLILIYWLKYENSNLKQIQNKTLFKANK